QRLRGPAVVTLSVPLSQMPVLIRAGAVIPTQPSQPYTRALPQRQLILTAYSGGPGSFRLYDDQGTGFGYTGHRYSWTPIQHTQRGRISTLRIGPARGSFPGAVGSRSWVVRLVGVDRPRVVRLDGHKLRRGRWSYAATSRTLTVSLAAVASRRAAVVSAGPA
ncbi:MAG TPA: DUF5110 domain-containing protein, partial [Solirubrobacteraceae bacterium]|nr:DUF5110 domain-containing protein [Solirubrobacteraceae bacterium]